MALLSQSRKKIGYSAPLGVRVLNSVVGLRKQYGIGIREILAALGPGFLVSVGYMDPGNWGTNLAAGAGYGYQLLWVILISNIIAIFLQIAAAKLGIATGKDLARLIKEQFPRPVAAFFGTASILAVMATDLAEILGGALGFQILFGIPLLIGAMLTTLVVMGLLAIGKLGFRRVEFIVIGMVSVIGLAYLFETSLIHPNWSEIGFHLTVPQLTSGSILVAVGILGATVMPHNVFLHSFLAPRRLSSFDAPVQERRKVLFLAKIDTVAALNVAFFVNAAMLIVAGTVFFNHVDPATLDLQTAYVTLAPALGKFAALAFGIGLLASGLSSSTTGTLAGQVVFEGFIGRHINTWVWRLLTMIPALIVILLQVSPVQVLVISQVVLSLQLPFTMTAVVVLSRRKKLMGEFADTSLTHVFNIGLTLIVTALNLLLLYNIILAR